MSTLTPLLMAGLARLTRLTLLALLLATSAAQATSTSDRPAAITSVAPADTGDTGDTVDTHGADRPTIKAINLNTATVEDLCTLPGVGRKKAEAILALRKTRPYLRVTQLLDVRGIGAKTLKRLKPYLTVTDAPTTAPGQGPNSTPKRS